MCFLSKPHRSQSLHAAECILKITATRVKGIHFRPTCVGLLKLFLLGEKLQKLVMSKSTMSFTSKWLENDSIFFLSKMVEGIMYQTISRHGKCICQYSHSSSTNLCLPEPNQPPPSAGHILVKWEALFFFSHCTGSKETLQCIAWDFFL